MADTKVFTLRMPDDLRKAVEKRAEERLRSINNEIVILLKLGLVNEMEESKALNTADKFISETNKDTKKRGRAYLRYRGVDTGTRRSIAQAQEGRGY